MTFEDAKEMLIKIKGAKNRARLINEEINELLSFKESLLSVASYNNVGFTPSVNPDSKVDRAVLKSELAVYQLDKKKEQLAKTLLEVFELEDRVAIYIGKLSDVEQDVIVGSYLRGRTHWQLADELGYSERSIRYIKTSAIKKISEKF